MCIEIKVSDITQLKETISVFISYAREDKEVAQKIYEDLKKNGAAPWIDLENLLPGQNWRIAISQAIKECDFFLAILSSKSVSKRGYVQKELKKALDILDEFPPSRIFIIPVRKDECKPLHEKLQDLHWLDLFPSYNEGLKKILKSLESIRKAPQGDRTFPQNNKSLNDIGLNIEDTFKAIRSQIDPSIGTMVKIPQGKFIYGDPGREIELEQNFEIGMYPVTNIEYEEFIRDGGYKVDEFWNQQSMKWRKENRVIYPSKWNEESLKAPEQPVVGVTFFEAEAFTKWKSQMTGEKYRLPTEKEWEKAARGEDGRIYPWGNSFDPQKCNTGESNIRKTTKVTIFTKGISPYGCFDMAGNVYEWCYTVDIGRSSIRCCRGGCWSHFKDKCKTFSRALFELNYGKATLGFRLVRSL